MSFRLPDDLEVGYRNKAPSVGYQRIACLVPIRVVLSADYMEKVAFGETEFLGITWVWTVVVEGFDDLGRRDKVSRARSDGRVSLGRSSIGLLTLFGGTMAIADLGVMEM